MNLSSFHKPSVKLKGYQREALGKMSSQNRFFLVLPTGTGKTLTSLSAIAFSLQFNKITRAIFVTEPKIAKQMAEEVNSKFNGLKSLVVTGHSKRKRMAMYKEFVSNKGYKLLIINYDLLKNDYQTILNIYLDHVVALIVDEATHVKNKTTKTHKVVAHIASLSQRVIGLSATPVYNSLLDIHTINQCLGIKVVSDAYFFKNHCNWVVERFGKREVRRIDSFKGIEEYYRKIQPFFYGKKKSEILDTRFSYKKINLQMGDNELEALRLINASNVSQVAIALSSPSIYTESEHLSEKEQDLMDFIQNDLEDKVLVYCPFKSIVERLEKLINAKFGHDFCVSIHGNTKDADSVKNHFIRNNKTKVLLGTDSISKGMDGIQTVCSTVYMFVLPISAGNFLQIVGRLSRIGGNFTNPVIVIPFVENGTSKLIDHDLYILIQNQLKLIEMASPDSLEEGCIDDSITDHLPDAMAKNADWLKSRIGLYKIQKILKED